MPQKKEILKDEIFGSLEWDERYDWFAGKIEFFEGVSVQVTLSPKNKEDASSFLPRARHQFLNLKAKLREVYLQMRAEYVALYNTSWSEAVNGYGEPVGRGKITNDEFDEFVYLESVGFEDSDQVELYFYDNDELFGGHSILVTLDPDLKIKFTGLEG